jgi:iron(III) transport system substrate-binding protein
MSWHRWLLPSVMLLFAVPALCGESWVEDVLGRRAQKGGEQIAIFTEQNLLEGARKEGTFLWYAGTNPMHKDILKAFHRKYPFLKAEAIHLGGPTLAQRFYADKERGMEAADVFSSGLTEVYPDLRSRDYLARIDNLPHWPAHPDWAKDPNGTYVYFHAIKHVIIYNTTLVNEREAPRSYVELVEPRWKDKVTLVDPDTGGAGIYFARFAAQHKDLGFAWLQKMRANGALLAYQTGQLMETVTSGRRPIGLGRDVEVVDAQRAGAPVKYVIAGEGFSYQFTTASVNNRAPHPYAARLFTDWLMSEEAKQVIRQGGYAVPAGSRVAIEAEGAWILDIEKITPQETREFARRASAALKGE